jgi:hypothetical protein
MMLLLARTGLTTPAVAGRGLSEGLGLNRQAWLCVCMDYRYLLGSRAAMAAEEGTNSSQQSSVEPTFVHCCFAQATHLIHKGKPFCLRTSGYK